MKVRVLTISSLLITLILAMSLPNMTQAQEAYELEVWTLTNTERTSRGLAPLDWDNCLYRAAEFHSQDMVDNDYFSHTGLNGSRPWDRAEDQGYTYQRIGENIAYGQRTPEAVMTAWMNSSGHRANILNSNYTEIGIGLVYDGSTPYWTMVLGRGTCNDTSPEPTEPTVEPTEPPVEPTEPPVEPTEPPVEPTEPPVEPTEPPVEPTEPTVEPTEPPTEPTEPPVEPTEPTVEPTEPPVEPTEPPVEPTEPPVEPTEPPVEPTDPPVEPTDPPAEPTEPTTEPTEPPVEPTEPTEPPVEPTEPPVEPTEPPVEPTEPPVEPTEPPVEPTEPIVESTEQVEPPPEPNEPDVVEPVVVPAINSNSGSTSTNTSTNAPVVPPPTRTPDECEVVGGSVEVRLVNVSNPDVNCTTLSLAGVGNQQVVEMGFVSAVDVWGTFVGTVEVCLLGRNPLVFMDAANSPRVPEATTSYLVDGFTCTVINRPGIVVQVTSTAMSPAPTGNVAPTTNTAATTNTTTNTPVTTNATGQTIHVVQSGENLFRIGLRYGVSVNAIMTANNLPSNTIFAGQELIIP